MINWNQVFEDIRRGEIVGDAVAETIMSRVETQVEEIVAMFKEERRKDMLDVEHFRKMARTHMDERDELRKKLEAIVIGRGEHSMLQNIGGVFHTVPLDAIRDERLLTVATAIFSGVVASGKTMDWVIYKTAVSCAESLIAEVDSRTANKKEKARGQD